MYNPILNKNLRKMKDKLIQNFLRHLIDKGVSRSSLKYYKSDISSFLSWAGNRNIDNKLVREYINNERLTTPISTLNRRLSTLRSYSNFVGHDFMTGIENVTGFRKVARSWQDAILAKFEQRPKLKNIFSKILFNRPNWYKRYHSYALANYIHIAILILFSSLSGYAVYDQVFYSTDRSLAFPTALERPNRFLSFQGRLTDDLGNPETVATNMVFQLYSVSSGGSALWNSGTCSITPDQDGIFSTLLGSSCGAEIASSVFSENADIWLGVTVAGDAEATPRIQIATVAYALNSETLQGFPAGTGTSTIPYIDSTGTVVLASSSPKIQSTSGTFAVEGQALTITTPNTSNGIVTINPDGTGTLDLTFEGASAGGGANGFVNATNANITSGSLYSGTVASNATGYNFINFLSGSSPTSKFSVQDDGDIVTSGDITIGGGNINTGNIALTIGDATTDSITLQTDGTGNGEVVLPNDSIGPNEIFSTGQTDEYCLTYEASGTTFEWQTCGVGGGGMTSFTAAGDSGGGQAIGDANTLSVLGGTNGIDTIDSVTDTITINLDSTEIGTTTFGSGSGIVWTFDVGATDPTLTFASDAITLTAATTLFSGDLDLADDNWIGLGSSAALIEFDDQATDEVNILNANLGIGTSGPDAKVDSLSTSGEQLRLTYTDGSVYSGFTVDSSGYLIVDPTGSRIALDGSLQVGSTSSLAYSRFGAATTEHAGNITASNDVLISGDMELDGVLYLDGGNIANSAGTASVILSSTPTTTSNTLSASNWLVENTANVGQAALMVNQTKSGDLFTASSSGTPKFTIHNDGSITLASDISSTTNSTEGTIFYDNNSAGSSSTDHLFMYGSDSAWHRIALDMTKYTQTNASVTNQNYIEITHNQNTRDIGLTGWVYDKASSLWRTISDMTQTIKHALQNEFEDAADNTFIVDTNGTLTENLVSFWTMNETSATVGTQVTRDDSFSSNNLTDNRSATSYILSDTGKINNSANLELSNGNFFEATDNTSLSTGDIDFTISAWVKMESESAGTTPEVIVSKSDSGSVREFSLYYTGATDDKFKFEVYDSGGTSRCNVSTTSTVTTDTWYHLIAWHDSVTDTCKIALNNGTADSGAVSGGVPSDTAANFRIGADTTSETNFFDGLIDEVGFWKKTLSTQEKTDLYNSGNANSYKTTGNLVRTQSKATNIELTQAFNTGTGADGAITISSDTSINTSNTIAGRVCADGGDAVNYSVTGLTATTATLESSPSTGCLSAGDEILIINLRGSNNNFSNVGNYETLRISSVAGSTVTFTTSKSKYYGAGPSDDTSIGTGTTDQVVMLQRVPNYTNVTITTTNTDFYPDEWVQPTGAANNGAGEGGVMFFRATGTVSIASATTIHATGKGYIGGTTVSGTTPGGDGGEAFCGIGGDGGQSSNGQDGAGGGGSGGTGVRSGGDGYCGGGGGAIGSGATAGSGSSNQGGAGGGGSGYAGAGGGGGYGSAGNGGAGISNGSNGGTETSGDGGLDSSTDSAGGGGGGGTYGEADLDTLMFGSSGGSGGAYTGETGGSGGDSGGIVYISANTVTVSGGIRSNGSAGTAGSGTYRGGGGGGSGGSIKIEGSSLTLGSSLVTATGGNGGAGATYTGGTGGTGRIAVNYESSISGTTSPSSSDSLTGFNTYGVYHSKVIDTPNAVNLESIKWEMPVVPFGNVSVQTRSGATLSPTDGTWEAWKPSTATTNYLSLSNADAYTDWTSSDLAVSDGDTTNATRNIDQFEDEDEATDDYVTKLYTTAFDADTAGTMTTSLTSYWPLNETGGNRSDSFASETLTDRNTVLSGTGKVSNAGDFESGSSEFLERTDDATLSTGDIDFTVGAWVNLESTGADRVIVSKSAALASAGEYELFFNNSTTRFNFNLLNSSGSTVCTVADTTVVSTSTWYYVVGWHDATANNCYIQVNNNTASSAPESGTVSDTAANFRIGARYTTEQLFFDGLIDEVGFWKKVLSSTERTDLYNSGNANTYPTTGQYAEDTITSTDLSGYDYLTFWVRASQTGSTVKFGMGESAATEQEETIKIDTADTWQKVYWDLSDIQAGQRDAITKLRFTNLVDAANTIYIDNVKAEIILSDNTNSIISSTPNRYLQYRLVLTTTNNAYQPQVENIYLTYKNGYKIEQVDTNKVRLYNYTGDTQELRLDAVVFGADLAEWYTVNDETIGAGDLVSLTGQLDEFGVPILGRSSTVNDPKLVGAISTKAGQALGLEAENRRLLGLAGRIPVKVDPNSQNIKAGDELTSSLIPGYATLAMSGDRSIGKATEDWTNESGKETVLILIDNSYAPDPTNIASNIYRYLYQAGSLIDQSTGRVVEKVGAFAILLTPEVKTTLISPIANTDLVIDLDPENATQSSKLAIQGINDEEVASIDAGGNANFIGTVSSEELVVNNDATVSGILYADNIESKRLEDIEDLLQEFEENQSLLTQVSSWDINTATESAEFANLIANSLQTNDLFVAGQAAIASLFVNDNFTVNNINSLESPLQIQSLAATPLEIMAGKIIVDTNGDTKFLGNVEIAGDLTINNIIVANNIDPIATDSASIIDGQINSNSTAGKATLSANTDIIRINNNKVNQNTLIYITPITSTQNKVLYVKSKNDGYFEVGFSETLDSDVEFNWWIIELK